MDAVRRTLAILGTMLVSGALLSGCAPAQPQTDPVVMASIQGILGNAQAQNDLEAIAALEDLVVTRAEVDEAAERMRACWSDAGLRLDEHGPNPLDGWWPEIDVFWDDMDEEEGLALSRDCQDRYFLNISSAYRLSGMDEIAEDVLPDLLACVERRDVEVPAGAANLGDLLPEGPDDPAFEIVRACADTAVCANGYAAYSITLI